MELMQDESIAVNDEVDDRSYTTIQIPMKSIIYAIKKGYLDLAKILIVNGADLDEPGPHMITPLHMAADGGHLDMIEYLVSHGAYVDPLFEGGKLHGFTPLYLAVKENHPDCVRFLLSEGASVTPLIEEIFHPIHYAVFYNQVEVARVLFQYGADANLKFSNEFFETHPIEIDRSLWLDHDLPLFHFSVIRENNEMAELLSTYADINSRITSLGKTALMQAVEVNSIKWVEALVTNENVNDRDSFGQPVLHFIIINANRKASIYSKKEYEQRGQKSYVLNVLVKNGADVNAKFPENQQHSSIIYYMIKYGFLEGVKYLLLQSCDFDFNEIDIHTLYSGKLLRENVTPDILDDPPFITQLNRRFGLLMYNIVVRAIDLQMIGLSVDENLILKRPIFPWIAMESYTKAINLHKNTISQQINYMKKTKVGDTNITLWNLLTCDMNKLVKFMSNKIVRYLNVLSDPDKNMFNYYSIMEKRLRCARKLKTSLEETTEQIATSLTNYLPFDCCQKIANFIVYNKDSSIE